ncbi:ATP-binding protein [Pyxidicoccus xibeiensis]|uniref:ATP-binding protein n=1 Tax=Pyxidicoccus xibeiensis TaxID=2906759 RepID=UPI0020A71694|nr:ATP-binding protein [Pyxidicoccus xibeiensis]MCP3136225.1 ATP-binding protein [Pyxidicoccus xibeiensis]
MRPRNESLRTGTLLAFFERENPRRNASVLFLVEGAADIAPMRDIESACSGLIEGDDCFQWHIVANQLELESVDSRLDAAGLTRFEVAELHGLSQAELRTLLAPAIAQLRKAERVRFPSATRAEGSVARGIDFLDREDELMTLQRLIEEGRNVLLVAPRRSGKTSLLCRLEELLIPRFRPLRLDVEKYRNVDAFAAELEARASGRRFIEALKQVRNQGWREVLTAALQELSRGSVPLVLILDELAWYLEHLGAEDGRALLEALDWALRKAGARLVVAGSLDLERFAREQLHLQLPGMFGALHRFPLPPLARPRLALNLRRVLLGTGLVLEQGDLEWMADNVDLAMPYPALRFLSHLASAARAGALSPAALERELVDYLASTDAFAELDEQLKQAAQRDPRTAEGFELALDRLASSSRPLDVSDMKALLHADPTKQAEHFNWLVEYFPLSVQGERVELASRLFQRYWRARGDMHP